MFTNTFSQPKTSFHFLTKSRNVLQNADGFNSDEFHSIFSPYGSTFFLLVSYLFLLNPKTQRSSPVFC